MLRPFGNRPTTSDAPRVQSPAAKSLLARRAACLWLPEPVLVCFTNWRKAGIQDGETKWQSKLNPLNQYFSP